MLQTAADTGLGLLWVKRTGQVAYLPVGQAGGWTPSYAGISLTDAHLPSPPNLLDVVDSSFEDGSVGSWQASANCTIANSTAQAAAGTHSLAITATGTGLSVILGSHWPAMDMTKRYNISGQFKAATTARPCSIYGYWFDPSGNGLGRIQSPAVPDSTTGWMDVAIVSAQPPPGTAYCVLLAWIDSTAAGEVHYLDDVEVTETTEDPYQADAVCVVDFSNSQPVVMRNAVSISRAADPLVDGDTPVAAIATDQASVDRYGPYTYSRTDLINQDDAWSAVVAGAVLVNRSQPTMHPQIADLDIRFDTKVADLLLGTEIGQVVWVHDSGQLFQCAVVGWTVDITREGPHWVADPLGCHPVDWWSLGYRYLG